MDKKIRTFFAGIILMIALAACQTANTANVSNSASGSAGGNPPANGQALTTEAVQTAVAAALSQTQTVSTATNQTQATTTVQETATVIPTATEDTKITSAIDAAKAYFSDLENQDYSAASELVSAQSLRVAGITTGDVSNDLQTEIQNGTTWSDLTVSGGQVFDSNTILVKVSYQKGTKDATTNETKQTEVDELWAMHLEGGKWLFNWDNIIDMKSVEVDAQTNSSLTITPLKMIRYTDKIELHMIARNASDESIYMAYSTETLATFYFGTQSVDAVNPVSVLTSNHTDTDYTISVAGLYTSYPNKVEILKYKDYPNVAPWFTFSFTD